MAPCDLPFVGRVLFSLDHGSGSIGYYTDAEWNSDGRFVAIGSDLYERRGLKIFRIEETGKSS